MKNSANKTTIKVSEKAIVILQQPLQPYEVLFPKWKAGENADNLYVVNNTTDDITRKIKKIT